MLAKELQDEKKYASTVTVKYKLKDALTDKSISKRVSCRRSSEFLKVAESLLQPVKGEIRMVGVAASKLVQLPTTSIDAFCSGREIKDPLPPPKAKRHKVSSKQTTLPTFWGW